MKSNYEIQKIKGLQLGTLEEWGGIGALERKDLPACSVVFCRNESGKYDHVSIAPIDGHTPTWDEMCTLKDLFFNDDEECVQIHPKAGEYVDIKRNCLHLWHRVDGTLY
jgi:hypothetical protein